MTAGPGDPGDTRTLQDPLAESLRIVDACRPAGPARPADGRHGHPRPRAGLAGPHAARRGRPRLRDPIEGPRRLLRAPRRPRATRPTSATTRCSAASRRTSWTCHATGRWTSSSTASRCATASSSAIGSPRRARRCPLAELLLSKLQVVKINRKDVLDALVLLAEHPLGQDDGAPDSRHGLGRDQRATDPVVHVERLGLVADGDRQPRHARPVPRRRARPGGSGPQQRPDDPVRSRRARSPPCGAPSTTPRSRRSGSSAPGSASGRPGTRPEEMGHD